MQVFEFCTFLEDLRTLIKQIFPNFAAVKFGVLVLNIKKLF